MENSITAPENRELYRLGFRFIVRISDHVNAAFRQEEHARAHFDKCRSDALDLPNADVKHFRLWPGHSVLLMQFVK